ncbi:hypothetical protein ACFFKZ_05055 [Neisseria gonorrhoeae]
MRLEIRVWVLPMPSESRNVLSDDLYRFRRHFDGWVFEPTYAY